MTIAQAEKVSNDLRKVGFKTQIVNTVSDIHAVIFDSNADNLNDVAKYLLQQGVLYELKCKPTTKLFNCRLI